MIVRMVYLYTDQSMKSQKNKSKRRQASVKRDRGGTPLTELAKVTNHRHVRHICLRVIDIDRKTSHHLIFHHDNGCIMSLRATMLFQVSTSEEKRNLVHHVPTASVHRHPNLNQSLSLTVFVLHLRLPTFYNDNPSYIAFPKHLCFMVVLRID